MNKHVSIKELIGGNHLSPSREFYTYVQDFIERIDEGLMYPKNTLISNTSKNRNQDNGEEVYILTKENVIIFSRDPEEYTIKKLILSRAEISTINTEFDPDEGIKFTVTFKNGHVLKLDAEEDSNTHWNRKFNEMIEDVENYLLNLNK